MVEVCVMYICCIYIGALQEGYGDPGLKEHGVVKPHVTQHVCSYCFHPAQDAAGGLASVRKQMRNSCAEDIVRHERVQDLQSGCG